MPLNPLRPLPTLGQARRIRPQQPEYQVSDEEEKSIAKQIGGGILSGLGMVGNFLDLPGSMIRDTLAWENPFDQWLTPFRHENRTTGRELLEMAGMRKNKETGIKGWWDDPGEGLRDVAGFGTEVLFDPLTYLTLGGASLTRSGQIARRAGILEDVSRLSKKNVGPRIGRQTFTLDDLLRVQPQSNVAAAREAAEAAGRKLGVDDLSTLDGEKLGKHFGLALPFQDPKLTFNLGPIGRGTSRGLDAMGRFLRKTWPVRTFRGLFDSSAGNQFDAMGQEISGLAHRDRIASGAAARKDNLEAFERIQSLYKAFDDEAGGVVRGGQPHSSGVDPRDLETALDRVMAQHGDQWELAAPLREFRHAHRSQAATARSNPTMDWPSLNEAGHPALANFDQILDDWADTLRPYGIHTPDDAWAFFQNPANPRWRRSDPEVIREATDLVEGGMRGEYNFTRGDVVRANDRGNYGYVRSVGPRESQVYFRNPDTGATVIRQLPNDQISRATPGPGDINPLEEISNQVADDILRATTELSEAREAFREIAPEIQNPSNELLAKFEEAAGDLGSYRNTLREDIVAMGGKMADLDDGVLDSPRIGHFPRVPDKKTAKQFNKGRLLPTSAPSSRSRTPVTRHLPAHVRDELLLNAKYRGEGAAQRIADDFERYLDPEWGVDPTEFNPLEFGDEVSVMNHAQALADWVHGKPRLRLTRRAYPDQAEYMLKGHAFERSLASIHEVFHKYGEEGLEEGRTLAEAFRAAGMDSERAVHKFREFYPDMTSDQLRRLRIPDDVVKGANNVIEYFKRGPKWQGVIADAIDGFNRWFKQNVTVLFPAFLSRNFSSGQHINLASGLVQTPTDIALYGREFAGSAKLLQRAKAAFKEGRPLEEADERILKELYAYNVVNPRQMFEGVEVSAPATTSGSPLEELLPSNPLNVKQQYRHARDFVASSDNALPIIEKMPGGMKARRGYRTAIEVGTAANQMVEWQNRVSLFMYLRQKGYSAAQASKETIARHFDYGDLTEFERGVMRRVVPFWTFSRKIAPLITKQLLQRPGGGIGQTIRATNNAAGGESEFLPQHIRETSAIPVGELDDGSLRFLTGLGLAHEDPLSFLGGKHPLRSAGLEAISRTNPLFKAPLEWVSGESFFQRGPRGGRDLDDMDPTVGRLLTNLGLQEEDPVSGRAKPFIGDRTEHALVNSPLARMLSTARQVTDERKREKAVAFPGDALVTNLLTGLKVSDVSPGAQDAVIRDMVTPTVTDELGGRSYENIYIPRETIQNTIERGDLKTAEKQMAFNRLMKLLSKRAKERKAARG